MADALNVFLLDRSGSMDAIKENTISNFNAYVKTLQEDGGDGLHFTFLQFDSQSLDKIHVNVPVSDVPPLTDAGFQPRGMTPLRDAIYKTIKATEGAVTPLMRVTITVLSDGHENASREVSMAQLNDLIKQKTEEGWQFNYLGASIDAYKEGTQMGFSAAACMSYNAAAPGMAAAAFAGTASNNVNFMRGLSADTVYSERQKRMAGDKFAAQYESTAAATHISPAASSKTELPPPTPIVDDFYIKE